jgi:hypothetical protein
MGEPDLAFARPRTDKLVTRGHELDGNVRCERTSLRAGRMSRNQKQKWSYGGKGPAAWTCVCAIAELATWCATPSTNAHPVFRTYWS